MKIKWVIVGFVLFQILNAFVLIKYAHAGPLDVLMYGVKNNPDRYVSFDLRGVYGHDTGSTSVLANTDLGGRNYMPQGFQDNQRVVKGMLTVPVDDTTSLMIGGTFQLTNYAYDATSNYVAYTSGLPSQAGNSHGYTVEAGLKFYLHE